MHPRAVTTHTPGPEHRPSVRPQIWGPACSRGPSPASLGGLPQFFPGLGRVWSRCFQKLLLPCSVAPGGGGAVLGHVTAEPHPNAGWASASKPPNEATNRGSLQAAEGGTRQETASRCPGDKELAAGSDVNGRRCPRHSDAGSEDGGRRAAPTAVPAPPGASEAEAEAGLPSGRERLGPSATESAGLAGGGERPAFLQELQGAGTHLRNTNKNPPPHTHTPSPPTRPPRRCSGLREGPNHLARGHQLGHL